MAGLLSFCSLFLAVWAPVVRAQNPYTTDKDSNGHTIPNYSPARPPAIPLAVRGPYTSAWSTTAHNGTLNSNNVMFWPGNPLGWEGIVTVDGISYEYLGVGSQSLPTLSNLNIAVPLSVTYDSSYSNFTFSAGPVEITASFLSPIIPKDLCRTSIPLSYLTTSVQSTDGQPHSVHFYSDVNAAWVSYENNVTIQWDLYQGANVVKSGTPPNRGLSSIYSWLLSLQKPYLFGENYQFPQWGNFTYSSSALLASNFTYQNGFSANLRFNYVMQNSLQNIVDPAFRASGDHEPVFAYAHDFGMVSSASVLYTIGSVQQPIVRYLYSTGIVSLQPWWAVCYGDIFSMIGYHFNDYTTSQQLAYDFDAQLKADVDTYYSANVAIVFSNSGPSPPIMYSNGSQGYAHGADQYRDQYIFDPNTAYGFLNPKNFTGIAIPDVAEAEAYYSIVALSARQVMGAYVFAIPPSGGCTNESVNASEPLMFQKEISSDGNVNTVDVMYPAMPFFLYANPELLKYNLEPLFQNQEGDFYPNGYCQITGKDEYMPVEESGNMILMSYAYYKFSGNAAWLKQHYAKLNQWAQYLIQYSLIPGIQLSTDDFAGQLVNQTNLAIKGIVGIQAMSGVATVAGVPADAANFSTTAASYYKQWEYFAIDPSGRHTMLGYEWRSSYGLLYNTYPDKLLNLGIIPQSLYEMQSSWYPTISQVFGIPLDNRHSYTKSDWEMWTAATCAPETRRLFVNGLGYWLNYTNTNMAFTDLYETIDQGSYPVSPDPIFFIARPVAGGHFSLLALFRSGQTSTTGTSPAAFPISSTSALNELPFQASVDLGPVQVMPVAGGSSAQSGLSVTTPAISKMTTIVYSNATMSSSAGVMSSMSPSMTSSTMTPSMLTSSTTTSSMAGLATETLTVTLTSTAT